MIKHKGFSITTLLLLALIVFLFFLPQLAGKYVMYMTMHILILSVFALGFNLLLGYTGLLSFGQAGFYACGAYGCAKLLLVIPSILPCSTLCFGMMIYSLAWKWHTMTGGDDGLIGIPRAPLEIPFPACLIIFPGFYSAGCIKHSEYHNFRLLQSCSKFLDIFPSNFSIISGKLGIT